MPDRPKRGDTFTVAGRRDRLTVELCHLVVWDDVTDVTRYLVTAEAGSRWSLIAVASEDGRRWIGTPLPADPDAPTS